MVFTISINDVTFSGIEESAEILTECRVREVRRIKTHIGSFDILNYEKHC
jgi:hypothetical protein